MASNVLEGDKELRKLLKRLPDKIFAKVLRGAVNRGIEPGRKEAIKNAERIEESGLLAESMGKKTKKYKRFDLVTGNVGPRVGFKRLVDVPLNEFELEFGGFIGSQTHKTVIRNPANTAHLVEGFKTPAKPHKISNVFGRMTVQHPGIRRPQPLMRAAFDKTVGEQLRRFRTFLAKGAVREARKLAKAR